MRQLVTACLCLGPTLVAADWVRIEPGSYLRGTDHGGHGSLERRFPLAVGGQYYGDDERPRHHVFITHPFEIAKHEVTVAEFRAFVEATSYRTDAEKNGAMVAWQPTALAEEEKGDWRAPRSDFATVADASWRNPGFPQADDHPVVGVSWNDAVAYCQWRTKTTGLTHRLPTEAEWEYAARAGNSGPFFWGDDTHGVIHTYANIANRELEERRHLAAQRHWLLTPEDVGDGHPFTAPVRSYRANALGLHDVSGNVWEWCRDYYKFDAYKQWQKRGRSLQPVAVDPLNRNDRESADNHLRVIRGGSWYTGPLAARTAARGFFDQPDAAAYLGFRVVRELKAPPGNHAAAYEAALKTLQNAGVSITTNHSGQEAHLDFRRAAPTTELLAAVGLIPFANSIRDISLKQNQQATLEAVGRLTTLTAVSFDDGTLPPTVSLAPLAKLTRLRNLSFGRSLTGITNDHLRQLSGLTSLRAFELQALNCPISDDGLAFLANNRHLRQLSIQEADLSGTFLTPIANLPLRELKLSAPRRDQSATLEPATLARIAQQFPELETLYLARYSITDDDLATLSPLKKLAHFDLQECPRLTDAGIAALLRQTPRLERLYLANIAAGPATADVLRNSYFLQQATFDTPAFDDAAVRALSRSRSLRRLRLGPQAIASPTGIAACWRIPNLQNLQLDAESHFGPAAADLAASQSLAELTIRTEALSPEVVGLITAIRPLKKLVLQNRHHPKLNHFTSLLNQHRPQLKVIPR